MYLYNIYCVVPFINVYKVVNKAYYKSKKNYLVQSFLSLSPLFFKFKTAHNKARLSRIPTPFKKVLNLINPLGTLDFNAAYVVLKLRQSSPSGL